MDFDSVVSIRRLELRAAGISVVSGVDGARERDRISLPLPSFPEEMNVKRVTTCFQIAWKLRSYRETNGTNHGPRRARAHLSDILLPAK